MDTETGPATSDLIPHALARQGRQFSFYQLNRLLTQYCEQQKDSAVAIRYQGKKSLAFPAADIESVQLSSSPLGQEISVELSFMGLYGPSSPLPAFYTERLLHSEDDSEAMRQLLDLINHHLIKNLQLTWEKYRYYVQFGTSTDRISDCFFSLAGIPSLQDLEQAGLEPARLLPLAPLLSMKTKNATSLQQVLQAYFQNVTVEIEQCITRIVTIPEDQCHGLGSQNTTLGFDIVMGDEVIDRMGKFRIHVTPDNQAAGEKFFPGDPGYLAMKQLVSLFLRDQYDFELCLSLDSEEMRRLCVGEQGPRLGWNSLLGDLADQQGALTCII